MAVRALRILTAAVTALVLTASPAFASLADEVAAGKAVAAQLDAGAVDCAALTPAQLEHLGEYVMDRMAGSRAAHAAMNARMAQVLGAADTERMHELIGRRFAGCAGASRGMMGAWGWMHDGAWQRMSAADWRELGGAMMGTRLAPHRRWGDEAVLAIVLAALLIGGLVTALLVARRRAGPSSASPSA